MNKSQERAVNRVLNYWKQAFNYDASVYEITHEVTPMDYRMLSLTVKVRRTDCEEGSPRAVFCADGGHFIIGARGAIEVCSSYSISTPENRRANVKHIAFMVHGKASKYA